MSLGPFLETELIRPLRVKMCKLLHMISWEFIFVVFAGNNQKPCYNNWRPLHLETKGSPPEGKVQFFLTLFKRPLTPPPFYLNICSILQGF